MVTVAVLQCETMDVSARFFFGLGQSEDISKNKKTTKNTGQSINFYSIIELMVIL